MPSFCSQTAYIFAVPMAPDSDAIGSAKCVDHDAMRPCCRRICHSVTSRGSRVSRLARASLFKRTSRIRRIARMPLGTLSARGQRATLIKWIARVALSSRKTRVPRRSRHPRTARRERPQRQSTVCGSEASAAPRACSARSLSLAPTRRLLFTSDLRTCITHLVTAFTTSPTRIDHPDTHTVASLISSRSYVPKT